MQLDRRRGVTLLELLIALVIVGLLATLAMPVYSDYMQRARRQDAITSLLQLHIQQEKWRGRNAAYATLAELGWAPRRSLDGYYALRLARRSTTEFRVIALPVASGPQLGDACGRFVLDQDGPVHEPGTAGPACWRGNGG